MCLTLSQKPVVKTTQKDRTFYKVLIEYDEPTKYYVDGGKLLSEDTSYLITPHRWDKATLGVLNCQKDTEIFPYVHGRAYDEDYYSINEGGFHLYTRKKDALQDVKDRRFFLRNCHAIVVKAVVPKGTKYVRGDYGRNPSVCVKKVRYEKL